MKAEIINSDGYTSTITTRNLVLVGAWFADQLPMMVNTSSVPALRHITKVNIIPDSPEELGIFRNGLSVPMTSEGAMSISVAFKKIAEILLKNEIEDGTPA